MIKLFRDITTGADNRTHEISRVIMLFNALMLIPILVIGVVAYIYGWYISKPFDIQTMLTAVLTYEAGVGTLMTSGAAAIFFKRITTTTDGGITETDTTRMDSR